MVYHGFMRKMRTQDGLPIQYFMRLHTNDSTKEVLLNNCIGKFIRLEWLGTIRCVSCNAVTKKSFMNGFCFSCFQNSPETSPCIMHPEQCRGHLGEGRDVQWEVEHHNQPHVVYLAATDAIKVGVTRKTQIPTRWIDQGAKAAIVLAETPNRYLAGLIEVALKEVFTDKTNWQRMLKDVSDESLDLCEAKWQCEDILPGDLCEYITDDEDVWNADFPVMLYPQKVKSVKLDSTPHVEGILIGIRGQYMLFSDGRVLNVRSHAGYELNVSI